jgi:hypothetical protein
MNNPNLLASDSEKTLRPCGSHEEPGQRHWYKITGLPGWRREQIGIPARGQKGQNSAAPAQQTNK